MTVSSKEKSHLLQHKPVPATAIHFFGIIGVFSFSMAALGLRFGPEQVRSPVRLDLRYCYTVCGFLLNTLLINHGFEIRRTIRLSHDSIAELDRFLAALNRRKRDGSLSKAFANSRILTRNHLGG